MKLEKGSSSRIKRIQGKQNICGNTVEKQCTETHAYVTPHIGSYASSGDIENISTEPIRKIPRNIRYSVPPTDICKATRFIYENEPYAYNKHRYLHETEAQMSIRDSTITMETDKRMWTLALQTKNEHAYEEIGALKENEFEHDMLHYYEKYSPTTAKTLINTLFLPRYKICKQCASLTDSPVYTDRLIYNKQVLYAKEMILYQRYEGVVEFRYCFDRDKYAIISLENEMQHYMPIYNYVKSVASSIFYIPSLPNDIFDLKSTLKPNIFVTCNTFDGIVNTELYHRNINDHYLRLPRDGCSPMTFFMDNGTISTVKNIEYDTDFQKWINYRSDLFHSPNISEPKRSSLLLLEPLLITPDLSIQKREHKRKSRMSHSENVRVIKVITAYTLSFFILVIITFYIVYFT